MATKEKLYVFTKKCKINLSCPLLQVIQGEIGRKSNSERDGEREGEKIKFSPWFVDGCL